MYWDHMDSWGWMMMVFWSLILVGFLGVIVLIAVQWTRPRSQVSPQSQPSAMTARELLDERLARGEIDTDEYQLRRDALEQRSPVGV